MGWDYIKGGNRRVLIEAVVRDMRSGQGWRVLRTHEANTREFWLLIEVPAREPGGAPVQRIFCALLDDSGAPPYRYGYKILSESEWPYYYSCPPEYLDAAPCRSAPWRAGVLAYHDPGRAKHSHAAREHAAATAAHAAKERATQGSLFPAPQEGTAAAT